VELTQRCRKKSEREGKVFIQLNRVYCCVDSFEKRVALFSLLHRAYCLIHIHFTNTCTCDSHSASVSTLIVKMDKTLKLLALQHVSVFHKTILRELFVPAKVTCCPLLFSKYAGSMSVTNHNLLVIIL